MLAAARSSKSAVLLSSLRVFMGIGLWAAAMAGDLAARAGCTLDGCTVCSGTGVLVSESSGSSLDTIIFLFLVREGPTAVGAWWKVLESSMNGEEAREAASEGGLGLAAGGAETERGATGCAGAAGVAVGVGSARGSESSSVKVGMCCSKLCSN